MVHLYRLILILAALTSFLPTDASALVKLTAKFGHSLATPVVWHSSEGAACSSAIAHRNGLDAGTGYSYALRSVQFTEGDSTASCNWNRVGPYDTVAGGDVISVTYSCPVNSTSSGSGCACASGFNEYDNKECRPANPCPAGQVEQGGACVPENCKSDEIRVNGICVKEPPCEPGYTRINGVCKKNGCEPGKVVGDRQAGYSCEDGCVVKANPSICVTVYGVKSCSGTGRQTGATCTPGSGDGPPTGPGDGDGPGDGGGGDGDGDGDGDGGTGNPGTGGGTGPGTGGNGDGDGGNGDGDGGSGDPGTGGGTNPDTGEPSTPGTGGGTGPGGGTPYPTPITEEPDAQGECPPGYRPINNGSACVKEDQPPDGDGKCPPGMVKVGNLCIATEPAGGDGDGDGEGDDSMFSGSCMAGFVCEGDAIQCAIAREQHHRACKLFEDKSPESDLYDKEKGKEGEQTKDLPGNREESMANRISTADAFGSGQCIQDLSVIVGGRSISLPFSKICPSLAIIGNIMVAVSLLLAIRIVGRG